MNAVAQLTTSPEEEFFETACKGELQKALGLIERLQEELQELRDRVVETKQVAAQKELLLYSASAQEQILRSQLIKKWSLTFD